MSASITTNPPTDSPIPPRYAGTHPDVGADVRTDPEVAATPARAVQSIKWVVVAVAVLYFGLYWFAFRNIVPGIPSVLRGEAVINGDELVPFFNPASQLIEQAAGEFNQLTHGYEFRVRYSILTTWMRYYKVLPFAILLVLPAVAFIAYLGVARFLSAVYSHLPRRDVYWAAAGPVLLVFLILSYSKITHFYTLVLGFMLFMLAALQVTYGLIFARRHAYRAIAGACITTLFNPAIHYLILFALFMSLTAVVLTLVEVIPWLRRGEWRRRFGWRDKWRAWLTKVWAERRRWRSGLGRLADAPLARVVLGMAMLGFLTLLPYALFVKFFALRGVVNLSETVPADYYFVKDASVPWMHILSLDMAGIMDKMLTGDYLAREPRLPNLVYSLLLFVPLLAPPVRRTFFNGTRRRAFLVVAYTGVIFSIWATLGYSEPTWLPTFHRVLSFISNTADATQSSLGDLVVSLAGTVVQVLRFPHRFQLIMLMWIAFLLPIALLWLGGRLRAGLARLGLSGSAPFVFPFLLLLFGVPFFANEPYRTVYGSGDFLGFLRPYPVTPLQEVKDVLLERPLGKVVVLPPTESAKVVLDIDGSERKFIDKFHIYYLDLPSYYYGLTGDSDNKHAFFLLLRALYYRQEWWLNIARDLSIRYIIINKELIANTAGGAEYLREIEKIIIPELDSHPDRLTRLFENESYVVYEMTDLAVAPRIPLFIDLDWNGYMQVMTSRLDLSRYYDLRHSMMLADLMHYDNLTVVTNNPHTTALNLFIKGNPKQFTTPSSAVFAFSPNVIPSSYYLSPMFRLFQFFADSKWNRLNMMTPGLFGTIRGSFVGLPRATDFRIDIHLPEAGEYRLLLRGAATANQLNLEARSLGHVRQDELRPTPGNLVFYDRRTVFAPKRQPFDTHGYSVAELERLIGTEIVAINFRYDYFDLGVVSGPAGRHTLFFAKLDNNPLLVEGVLAIPEAVYHDLELPPNVHLVQAADLCCPPLQSALDPTRLEP